MQTLSQSERVTFAKAKALPSEEIILNQSLTTETYTTLMILYRNLMVVRKSIICKV